MIRGCRSLSPDLRTSAANVRPHAPSWAEDYSKSIRWLVLVGEGVRRKGQGRHPDWLAAAAGVPGWPSCRWLQRGNLATEAYCASLSLAGWCPGPTCRSAICGNPIGVHCGWDLRGTEGLGRLSNPPPLPTAFAVDERGGCCRSHDADRWCVVALLRDCCAKPWSSYVEDVFFLCV